MNRTNLPSLPELPTLRHAHATSATAVPRYTTTLPHTLTTLTSPVRTHHHHDHTYQHDRLPCHLQNSSPPRPLSQLDSNLFRTAPGEHCYMRSGTKSSPVTCKTSDFGLDNASRPRQLSRFAARPTRPNPVVVRREDKQDARRRLFMQNVRARSDEKRWQRRGGDDGLLKQDFLATTRKWKAIKEQDEMGVLFEKDIEELALLEEEARLIQAQRQDPALYIANKEAELLEALRQEEDELERYFTSFNQEQTQTQHPESVYDLEGDEYDDIFSKLTTRETGVIVDTDIEML